MADVTLLEKVHELSDLELAALICLVAQEHCIIDTEPDAIDDLAQELQLVQHSLVCGTLLSLIDYRLARRSLVFLMLWWIATSTPVSTISPMPYYPWSIVQLAQTPL